MNFPLSRLLLIALLCLTSATCKKKEEEDPVYRMSARVNGAPWNSNIVTCVLLIDTTNNARIVNLTSTYNSQKISVEFTDPTGSGNTIATGGRVFYDGEAFFNYSEGSDAYEVVDGDVTVNYCDAGLMNIDGGFDFTVRKINGGNEVHVSYGGFNDLVYTVMYR